MSDSSRKSLLSSIWILFPVCLSLSFILSCKTRSEIRREQELERLKQEVSAVRGERADIDVVSEELRLEVARLGNVIEERTQQTKTQVDELKSEVSVLSTKVQGMEQKRAAEDAAERQAAEARTKASYESGKKLFDEGRFEEAAEMLKAVVAQHPKTDEARKSSFLLAETYYSNKDFASAALEFGEYRKNYPKDTLIPSAIYRQAVSFRNMGKAKEARLFYQELIERFPKNALATKSKLELKKLK